MLVAYVDESENIARGLRYTAATAGVFLEGALFDFRKELIGSLSDLLLGEDRDPRKIDLLPILHASAMPSEMTDEQIISAYRIIFSLVKKYGVRIFRVGYFDASVPRPLDTREKRIDFCLSNVVFPIQSLAEAPIIYVYELHQAARKKMISYNDARLHEMVWQSPSIQSAISIKNYNNIVGKFYCDKHNHHMYVADFCGYALSLRDKTDPTEFQKKIVMCIDVIEECICYDTIIYMNDISRTIRPGDGPRGE